MATTKRITPGREGYKILFGDNTVIMNKKFAAAAAKYGTKENRIIRNIRHDFPGMTEVIVSGRECDKAKTNSRLTYENMEKHIRAYDNAEDLLDVFETVKALSKTCASPYKYVCDWFKAQFPNYKKTPVFEDGELKVAPAKAPDIIQYKQKMPQASQFRKGEMKMVTFYREWLPLPKSEFNILAMIAEQGGTFAGNWSDMCRYLGVTPQSRNRKVLQTAIESLTSKGFITWDSSGRTQTLKVIPKATEITIPKRWMQSVVRHDYSSEAVAAAPVLKVFLWIVQNTQDIVTNDMIAADLGVSVSTVVSAKNVLEREYENITKRKVSEKLGENIFRTLGQELAAGAWWNDI